MRRLLEDLFPIYRTLCGPGALQTLQRIQQELPDLGIHEYPSGTDVCGWTIPKEFVVNEAWVKNAPGEMIINFAAHPYSLWIYSQPFSGKVVGTEFKRHLATKPEWASEFPLRQTYYKDDWGFSMPHCNAVYLSDFSEYEVHIDVEHRDGFLRIGEYYLPGETSQEILVNSYICHPLGANDNLSGVVASVELFKRLSKLRNRRYSYRLCLWPETIGPITWISQTMRNPGKDFYMTEPSGSYMRDQFGGLIQKYPNILCALTIAICGDKAELKYDASITGDSIIDRAMAHAIAEWRSCVNSKPIRLNYSRPYSGFMGATDSRHFNGMGVNIPAVTLTRGGPCNYPEYHSSADTPEIIDWDNMEETVDVAFKALQVIERNQVYRPNYITTPCLQKHGIFPYQHGTGNGEATRTDAARAYFELMYLVDGKMDLLSIADSQGMSIFDFDEPVEKFLQAGLISEA